MIEILLYFIAWAIMVSLFISFYWIIDTFVTKSNSEKYGWASYKTFKKEYSKYKWELTRGYFGDVITSSYGKNRLNPVTYSATFEGADMIINNPFGYVLTKLFIRRQYRKFNKMKVEKVKW